MQRIFNAPFQDLDMELKRIGAKHAFLEETCGVDVHAVERLGELIVEAFIKLDGVAQSKESKWACLLLPLLHSH